MGRAWVYAAMLAVVGGWTPGVAGDVHQRRKSIVCGRDIIHTEIVHRLPADIQRRRVRPRAAGGGLVIDLRPGGGLQANPEALAAFQAAAQIWEDLLFDPVTVVIEADIGDLGPDVLGATSSVTFDSDYTTVRDALVADALADEDIVDQLPVLAQYDAILPAGFTLLNELRATRANLKALGFDFGTSTPDASITFSSSFEPQFDYDPSNGISALQFDFEGLVVHEIGHALGFTSAVDTVEFTLSQGQTASVKLRVPDMFRLRPGDAAVDFTGSPRVGVPGNLQFTQMFFDGANELKMSTGAILGDGFQASHWKEQFPSIGLMDPAQGLGERTVLTDNDIRAFGLIGWDLRQTVCGDGVVEGQFEECDPPDGVVCGPDCLFQIPAACADSQGDCCGDNPGPGCSDPVCCASMCETQPFCCATRWDSICAFFARQNPDCVDCFEPQCQFDTDCTDDGNPCTIAVCNNGLCEQLNAGTIPCDDGDACTTGSTCAAGVCQGGQAVDCDDANPCTDDSCDSQVGCQHADNTDPCDDGDDLCTIDDVCSAGQCVGTPKLYGDLAGNQGTCGPDNTIDIFDIFAVLDGFQGVFAEGCGFDDINIAGAEGSCTPNQDIDIFDIFAVLDAFQGIDPCCGG